MTPTVENFVNYFLSPAFQFSPWAEFVDGYWRLRDRENVLFMTYEEMKKDLKGAVGRVDGPAQDRSCGGTGGRRGPAVFFRSHEADRAEIRNRHDGSLGQAARGDDTAWAAPRVE